MLGPYATVSRCTLPALHCHSPGVTTVACRLRINVHDDDDDNNDNAWQRGLLWPHRMGPIKIRQPLQCTSALWNRSFDCLVFFLTGTALADSALTSPQCSQKGQFDNWKTAKSCSILNGSLWESGLKLNCNCEKRDKLNDKWAEVAVNLWSTVRPARQKCR